MNNMVVSYKDFLKYLEENPFIGHQEACGIGDNYWNADYWTMEVTRYLIFGDDYFLPVYLKNNQNADPNRTKLDANIKLSIKKILSEIKDSADYLLVCEVGRGLDILIANEIKKWKKIYCYDHVDYKNYLVNIFDNIDFIQKSTDAFIPEIDDKYIVIMNHSIYPYEKFKNKNSVYGIHGIINGELKW